MFISDFAIKRPIVTITAMLALVAFGVAAWFNLQTDEFPDVQQPVVAVTIAYPGASPETVEREIIDPIEDAFSSISGIDWTRTESHATDGLATFVVFFDFNKNIQQASQDVRDAISTKRADLPTEMKEPVLSRLDPGEMAVISIALTSNTVPATTLTRLADPDILRTLRSVPGVAEASLVGDVQRELSVDVRPADLQAAGVSVSQVVGALAAQNLAAPVGRVTGPLEEQNIRLKGRLDTPEQFQQLVVADRGGELIRLGQIATVVDGTEEQRTAAFFDGKQAVGIEVKKAKGYSTTQVTDQIQKQVDQIQKTLPAGVKFEIVQNAGTRVSAAVRNVEEALIEGALLTVLVVFLFLNSWRSTVITGLALPVSVLASFIAVWAFGFTLNTMSLLGLSLAIGILIDDAIVVRENIVRHIELGEDHYTASQTATDEIGLAVAATTFSIVAVFVPVAFMYGVAGQWFKPFALTIACAVLVSLFVSFSLDPMLSAYWPDPQVEAHELRNPIARLLGRFNKWFDRTADRYKGVVAWALDHRAAMVAIAVGSFIAALMIPGKGIWATLVVLVGLVAIVWILIGRLPGYVKLVAVPAAIALTFVAIAAVPTYANLGSAFVPVSDRSEINVIVQAPPGSSLDYTVLKSEEMARILRQHKEVAYTFTQVGTAIPMHSPSVDQSLIYVRLVPKTKRSLSQDDLGRIFRGELNRVSGADASVFTSGFGGALKEIQVQMRGPDAAVLTRLAEQAAQQVKQVPGAVDVGLSTRGQKPELEVNVDRGLAGTLGITVGEIAQSLRAAFAGIESGYWVDPSGETRHVVVRLAPESRARAADLRQMPLVVSAQNGPATLPLGQVATITSARGPAQIDHIDREQGGQCRGQHPGPPTQRGSAGHHDPAQQDAAPRRLLDQPGGTGARSGRGLRPDLHRARHRGAADVSHPGGAVRFVHRPAGDHDLTAAVAHRCGAGALDHPRHPQPDESDRRHPADGHRGQERDPADRLRQVAAGGGRQSARGTDRSRPNPASPDHHDDDGAGGRHDSGGTGPRRRRRLPRAAGPRRHRRHPHRHVPHPPRDPHDLRDPRRLARMGDAFLRPRRQGGIAPGCDSGAGRWGGLRADGGRTERGRGRTAGERSVGGHRYHPSSSRYARARDDAGWGQLSVPPPSPFRPPSVAF